MFKKLYKNLNSTDIALTKIGMFAFTLWLISLFPSFTNWAQSTNHWYFLAITIITMIIFFYRKK